jgi:hypothetical protein
MWLVRRRPRGALQAKEPERGAWLDLHGRFPHGANASSISARRIERRRGEPEVTTRRSYTCNLCNTSIKDRGHDDRGFLEGIGLYFQNSPNPPMKFTRCNEAEHHICLGCIEGLKAFK